MSQDDIVINLKSDLSEGEAARKKLEQITAEVNDLKQSFQAGNVALDNYKGQLKDLSREANRAQKALDAFNDAQIRSGKVKLQGSDRANAKFQLGLAGANLAQDVIQGGPASGINNLLGLAQNGKVRSLLGEFVEGAGGVASLTTKVVGVGAAFAALFAVVDQGLKSAKLEWSDLDDVVGELGPIRAAKEAWAGLGEVAKQSGLTEVAESAYDAVAKGVGDLAEATIGWNTATDAAKANKEVIEGAVKATRDYVAAVKLLSGVRSEAQDDQARKGKLFVNALADAGGAGGLDAILGSMAKFETARTGGQKVSVPKLDDKGQNTGEKEEITRGELALRRLQVDAAKAAKGDQGAMDRLLSQSRAAGIGTKGLESAAGGIDPKQAAREAFDRTDDAAREGYDAIEDELEASHKRAADLAKPLQDRFNLSTASGGVVTEGQVRGKLEGAGVDKAEAGRVAGLVLENLTREYGEAIRERAGELGTDAAGARQSIVDDAAQGADRDRTNARRQLGLDKDQGRSAQVLNGAASLRDSLQQALGQDDTSKKSLAEQQRIRETLERANELLLQISKNPRYAAFAGLYLLAIVFA